MFLPESQFAVCNMGVMAPTPIPSQCPLSLLLKVPHGLHHSISAAIPALQEALPAMSPPSSPTWMVSVSNSVFPRPGHC